MDGVPHLIIHFSFPQVSSLTLVDIDLTQSPVMSKTVLVQVFQEQTSSALSINFLANHV